VLPVASGIGVHPAPVASQRCHAYANVIPEPVQVPVFMTAQSDPSDAPPDAGQRTHWYVKVGAGSPVQVPGDTVSVCPSDGMPAIVGGTVF
jgi:hypothetical protein